MTTATQSRKIAARIPGLLAGASLFLTGCARSVVTTEVQPDGAWKRTVKLYGAQAPKDGQAMGQTIDAVFIPPQGAAWKITRGPEKPAGAQQGDMNPFGGMGQSEVLTAVRTLAPGATLAQDVALKPGSADAKIKGPLAFNAATVKQIAPGRFEYREVVHWQGPGFNDPQFKDVPKPDAKAMAEFQKLLPPELATPANMQALQRNLMREMWRMLFGPNDPLLPEMFSLMFFPDTVERKMMKRIGGMLDRSLTLTFKDALSDEKRLEITRALAKQQFSDLQAKTSEKASSGPPAPNAGKDGDSAFVALTFSVKMPGKVVETNGDLDPIMNEVYWTFYAPAAMAGDVEMRAVCEVKP